MISIFLLITSEFRGNIRHHERRDWMETESALYQLMGVRMNGVMNSITNSDGQYQEIIRFGMLAYLLGFSDCKELLLEKCLPIGTKEKVSEA